MEAKALVGDTRPRIDQNENTKFGIYNYDQDNAYPDRMQVLSAASGTTIRCLKTFEKFLVGLGFADKDFWKKKISRRGLRVDGLLRRSPAGLADDHMMGHEQLRNPVGPTEHIDFRRGAIREGDQLAGVIDAAVNTPGTVT